MRAVLENFETAPIPEREKALWRFLERVNRESWTTTADDVARVREAGWSDEALYDAISVVALFRFFNTWADAHGVTPMPPEAHEASGKRLKEHGYA